MTRSTVLLVAAMGLGLGCTAITNPDRFRVGADVDAGALDDAGMDAGAASDGGVDAGSSTDGGSDGGLVVPFEVCLPAGAAVAPVAGDGTCAAPLEFDLSSARAGDVFEYSSSENGDANLTNCLDDTDHNVAAQVLVPAGHYLEISVAGEGVIPRLVEMVSSIGACDEGAYRCRGENGRRCRAMTLRSSPSTGGGPDLVRFLFAEVENPPSGNPITLRMHVIPAQDCSPGDSRFCEEFGG